MSGKDESTARGKAEQAVADQAAQRGHQRHVLDLGDRAVEVVAGGKPGVWHLATGDGPVWHMVTGDGPVLHLDEISAMLETDRKNKAAKGRSGRPEDPPVAGVTGPSVSGGQLPYPGKGTFRTSGVPVPGRVPPPLEEYLTVMNEPAGLTSAELEALVPDQPEGTCLSCRMPLTARDKTGKCTWCLALHDLRKPAPAGRPVAIPGPGLRPAWPCECNCPSAAAHQIHIGVRPVPPARRSPAVPVLLLAGAVIFWYLASHVYYPFIIPAVTTFIACLMSAGRRR